MSANLRKKSWRASDKTIEIETIPRGGYRLKVTG